MARLEDGPDGKPLLHVDSAADLLGWLLVEHVRPTGVWLVRARRGSGLPEVDYEDVITALLRFGWIDASVRRLDDQRSLLWISPRRRGSVWSKPNKQRVAELEAQGRLDPAGRAAVDRAKQDGSWTVLDGPENLEVPDDLAVALAADPQAAENFAAFPPSARKNYLAFLALAKTAQTRQRRIDEVVRRCAANRRPG